MAGNAYIVNCTPFALNFIVNNGTPARVAAIRPTAPVAPPAVGSMATSAYVVPYSTGLNPDQIGGTNNPLGSTPNSLLVMGPPYVGGLVPNYQITVNLNNVPLTSDIFFWVSVDAVYGTDSSGQSAGFTIQRRITR